jgi:hypothetical protein
MPVIHLRAEDPIVRRASGLATRSLTEVGFIPGDEFGCKIYASNQEGILRLIGMHSRSYGCQREQQTDGVEVAPPAKTKRVLA